MSDPRRDQPMKERPDTASGPPSMEPAEKPAGLNGDNATQCKDEWSNIKNV